MRLALYQPDIPPNLGAMMRLCACMGVPLDVIEPCGFPFGEKSQRRAAMDYGEKVDLCRHRSWHHFRSQNWAFGRLVLLSTKASTGYADFEFEPQDVLLVGQETSGVPDHVWRETDAQITVPMASGLRSLNVVTAAAMVLGEALRQTDLLPAQEFGSTAAATSA